MFIMPGVRDEHYMTDEDLDEQFGNEPVNLNARQMMSWKNNHPMTKSRIFY